MTVCRTIGWVFIAAALGALAYEAVAALDTGSWRMIALGEIWFRLNAGSLNLAQAVVQRYVAPWVWEPGITTILLLPAWVVFGVPGVLLVWLCRKRRRYFEKRLG